jgi:hypothetical protein
MAAWGHSSNGSRKVHAVRATIGTSPRLPRSIHLGHAHVHQDNIEVKALDRRDGLSLAANANDLMTCRAQEEADDIASSCYILNDQDIKRDWSRRGGYAAIIIRKKKLTLRLR